MAINPAQLPPNVQHQGTLELPCPTPSCMTNGRKLLKKQPAPEFINAEKISLVSYVHEQGITCRYCNTYFQIGIQNAQVAIQWGLIPRNRPSDIVIAPPGALKQ